MKVIKDPKAAPAAGAYSPALQFGNFVMVSGQGPLDSEGKIVSGTIEEETRLTLQNIKRLLEEANANMDHVVSSVPATARMPCAATRIRACSAQGQ